MWGFKAQGVVRIVHRGLVRDCVNITSSPAEGLAIAGNGVNKPATLKITGNCFNLYNEFHYSENGLTYTGYEYQNGEGHCLWMNQTSYVLELGVACNATDPAEQFFGYQYVGGLGWLWGNVAAANTGLIYYVDSPPIGNSVGCTNGAEVQLVSSAYAVCDYWNFPTG